MEDSIDSTYHQTLELIDQRLTEAWKDDEVIADLKETVRRAQKKIIERIKLEAKQIDKDRDKLIKMRLRIKSLYSELEEKKEEWNTKTFIALAEGIQGELATRKHFPFHVSESAFEHQLWRCLTDEVEVSTQGEFEYAYVNDEKHRIEHDTFLSGQIELMNGNAKKAIEIWQSTLQDKKTMSPGILRELGVIHRMEGSGIFDAEKAMQYYEQAALKGSVMALHSLGVIYKFGTDKVEADFEKAKFYYELAAQRGSAAACSALGQIYHQGVGGVQVDLLKAKTYYSMAWALSSKDASENIKELNKLILKK